MEYRKTINVYNFFNNISDRRLRFILLSFGILLTANVLFHLLQTSADPFYNNSAYEAIDDFSRPLAPIFKNKNQEAITTDFVFPMTNLSADQVFVIPPITFTFKDPTADEHFNIKIAAHKNLPIILRQLGVNNNEINTILSLPQSYFILNKLTVGHILEVILTPNHQVQRLIYHLNNSKYLLISRINKSFQSVIVDKDLDNRLVLNTFPFNNSLANSVRRAHLSAQIAAQLQQIFATQVDVNNLGNKARVSIIYQEFFKHGRAFKTGNIVAAQIMNGKSNFAAVRNEGSGKSSYYTPQGKSLEKAFLRAPVHYSHISSPFSLHRYHPILHFSRPHEGVDFAAAPGTPVVAASDGMIVHVGRKGGYGNAVMIRHDSRYTTVYGHLSRYSRGLHTGMHVREGQVIGFVGMSGLASGYHLHYEVRINGTAYNPLTIALPHGNNIPNYQLRNFRNYAIMLTDKFKMQKSAQVL